MKQALRNFIKVFLTNGLLLISGILVGFIIPRIMGVEDYAYYKTFSLYNSYKELITFGISEGMYLWLAGKPYDDDLISHLKFATKFFILLEGVLSLIIIIIALSCYQINPVYSWIFVLTSLFCFAANIESFFASVSQSLKEFKIFTQLVSIKSILTIISVFSLYCLHKFGEAEIFFYYYAIVTIILSLLNDIVYFIYYLQKSKNHTVDIGSWTKFLKLIISLGIPLLLANLCQTMILTIDRQIISIFYPVEKSNVFALYSFAYNLLALVSSMVSAIATVLFPYMKGKDENKLINFFPLMHCSLLIVLAFGCCIYFFMVPIIDWLLPKYNDSLPIFKVLLPGIVISSTISILFHSYYKTFALEKAYFIQSLIVLFAALLTDLGVYYLVILKYSPNNPIGIAVASTVVMFLWYFCSLLYFQKKHPVKHIKNDIFMVAFISAFYIVSIFVTSWWIGFLVYFSFACVLSFLLYHKEARKLVILIKEKKKNE